MFSDHISNFRQAGEYIDDMCISMQFKERRMYAY